MGRPSSGAWRELSSWAAERWWRVGGPDCELISGWWSVGRPSSAGVVVELVDGPEILGRCSSVGRPGSALAPSLVGPPDAALPPATPVAAGGL